MEFSVIVISHTFYICNNICRFSLGMKAEQSLAVLSEPESMWDLNCRSKINLKMHRASMVFFQIYKIDIRPLTTYCKGILCEKKNVLVFAIASLEGCSVKLTSGCSKLKVPITSLLVRSWENGSFEISVIYSILWEKKCQVPQRKIWEVLISS